MAPRKTNDEEKNRLSDQLRRRYKLVILDEESLAQNGSYSGSLLKYLTLGAIISALISILTIALISYTPLRRLIPGYGDIEENRKFIDLRNTMKEMETTMEIQQTYISGIQTMLSGEKKEQSVEGIEKQEDIVSGNRKINVREISSSDIKYSKKNKGLTNMYLSAPVIGTVSAGFDLDNDHFGVDILAAKGEAIKSVASGIVISSDWSLDAGNTIAIQHENNTISVYKHNSTLLKKTGENVKSGEAIAIIGNSGTLSDGPHLHLELWHDGTPVNPENYITF